MNTIKFIVINLIKIIGVVAILALTCWLEWILFFSVYEFTLDAIPMLLFFAIGIDICIFEFIECQLEWINICKHPK